MAVAALKKTVKIFLYQTFFIELPFQKSKKIKQCDILEIFYPRMQRISINKVDTLFNCKVPNIFI